MKLWLWIIASVCVLVALRGFSIVTRRDVTVDDKVYVTIFTAFISLLGIVAVIIGLLL